MKYLLKSRICLGILIVLSSCTTLKYSTDYKTHLLNSEPKSLAYKDSLFDFNFHPVPNGLYFNITNLSDVPATIIWNSCYFIEPTGNPSRALNIDGIIEDTRTREMANNESVIPPHKSFGRFTTSALNVQAINQSNSNFYFFKSHGYSHTMFNTFYNYGRYWPNYKGPSYFSSDSSLRKKDISMLNISNYVRKNNSMGVGFCLRVNDSTINYKFDFKIDKIAIYYVRDTATSELAFFSVDTSDWIWRKAPLPTPTLLKPENNAVLDSLIVKLRWYKPIDANYSVVQVSADSLFRSIIYQDTTTNRGSKYYSKLKKNCTYYWRVLAKSDNSSTEWSAPRKFIIKLKYR